MNGRKIKIGATLLMATVLCVGMERTPIRPSIYTFVQSYEAVKKTDAPMGLWERLVYSVALTKQRFNECRAAHGSA